MKVALIQPKLGDSFHRGHPAPPLGLLCTAAAIQDQHEVLIIDRDLEPDSISKLKSFNPDVVGVFSMTGSLLLDGLEMSEQIKEEFQDQVPVVWGGPHTTLLPQQVLHDSQIDFVVTGEGESTFPELLQAISGKLKLKEVAGIGYKQRGKTKLTASRPLIEDLDSLPFPAWELVDYKRYLKYETTLYTSRGCPHRCAFCSNKSLFPGWRSQSAKRVLAEIEYLDGLHPIQRLRFNDEQATTNKKRFHQILDGLPNSTRLYFDTRVDYLDEEMAKRLSRFEDPYLFIGVESGSPRILKAIQKDITVEQIRQAFNLLKKYDIDSTASFIIGLPTETEQDVEQTINLIDELDPARYTCCIYMPNPGSPLYDQIVADGKFTPPTSTREWGEVSSRDTAQVNVSEIPSKKLEAIYQQMWRKTVWSYIRKGRFRDIYTRVKSRILP